MSQNFISSFLQHTSIYESPSSFWKWSAYASIAAVLRDNCYIRQGSGRLYPNIYVLFLAESSGHRKGRPVDVSETIVTKVNNTKIISGRTSIQAVLDELSRTESDKKTGRLKKAGSAIFYASELAAGIVADPAALEIITDIYDYKSNPYRSRLRTGPCFNLERIVFSILAASNEDMIKNFFNHIAVKGGMLARTFLITPNEFRSSNSLMHLDHKKLDDEAAHVYSLFEKVAELEGEFCVEESAKEEYEKWYNPFRQSYQTKKEASGIVGRIHTGVLKVAMLLAANDLRKVVCKRDIEQAIEECLALIPNYSLFTMNNTSKNDIQKVGGLLITYLLDKKDHLGTRKEIIRDNWQGGMDHELLEKAVVMLEAAGMIQIYQDRTNGIGYGLTKLCLKTMGRES